MNNKERQYLKGLYRNNYKTIKEIDSLCRIPVFTMVKNRGGNKLDAEDVFQEGLMAVVEKIDKEKNEIYKKLTKLQPYYSRTIKAQYIAYHLPLDYDYTGFLTIPFRAFILDICHKAFSKTLRRRGKIITVDENKTPLDVLCNSIISPQNQKGQDDDRHNIILTLDSLDNTCKEIMQLTFMQELIDSQVLQSLLIKNREEFKSSLDESRKNELKGQMDFIFSLIAKNADVFNKQVKKNKDNHSLIRSLVSRGLIRKQKEIDLYINSTMEIDQKLQNAEMAEITGKNKNSFETRKSICLRKFRALLVKKGYEYKK